MSCIHIIQLGILASVMTHAVSLAAASPSALPAAATSQASWPRVHCPTKCSCGIIKGAGTGTSLRAVQCSKQKLASLPEGLPSDAEVLHLQGNALSEVQTPLASFTLILEIDLSFNDIASLGSNSEFPFANVTSLERLNLAHNQVASIPVGAFAGLARLTELVLSNNVIDTIHADSFRGLTQLRKLNLAGNKLQGLGPQWFRDLTNLETLRLDGNDIEEIPDVTFSQLRSMTELFLDRNKLRTNALSKVTFKGTKSLETLDLSKNEFANIPSLALTAFTKLKTLTLDSNPTHRIGIFDIRTTYVREIHISKMPELVGVDADAFFNLSDLAILHMHDNPKLMYIDPAAFHQVPHLSSLYLHGNSLMALSKDLISSLPALISITFYSNPIHCDCNIHWIKELLLNRQNRSGMFLSPDKFICHTPVQLKSRRLMDVSLADIPQVCSPTVIPFFNDSYQRQLGDSITFECRGIGDPQPRIHWILANGKVMNNTSNVSHIRLDTTGTLSITHLKALDAGTYTCVATNINGYDTTSAVLRVHNQNIHILYRGVATNFVTVTWNGTSSTVTTSNYMILYRKAGTDSEYRKIHIRPYMREYTISNLKPETSYEFCVGYQHGSEITNLDCMQITTKHQSSVHEGVTSVKKTTVALAFVAVVLSVIFLCLTTVVVRRWRRRKLYKEPDGTAPQPSSSGVVNVKVGNMSQIPLDNLYNPPSTPLYTSRTSLIPSGSSA